MDLLLLYMRTGQNFKPWAIFVSINKSIKQVFVQTFKQLLMKGYKEIVQIENLKFKKLYDEAQIMSAIDLIADNVNVKLQGIRQQNPEAKILLVGILNGAFMFLSELVKRMAVNVSVEFIKCKSYRGMESGELEIVSEFKWDLAKDAYVLIVDDICDSGKTLGQLVKLFQDKGAHTVETAVLVNRPDKVQVISPNYSGLTCSAFIIGFGLDYNHYGRQFPQIYEKTEE